MAHLYRLIFALLLLWSGGAHALIPKVTGWYAPSQPSPVTYYETAEQACRGYLAVLAAANPGNTYVFVAVRGGGTGTADTCDYKSNGVNGAFGVQKGGSVCPANSTSVTGGCSCNSPYIENSGHTACVLPPNECQQKAGQPDTIWRYDGGYGATPNPLASELCKAGTGTRCIVKVADPQCTQGRFAGTGNPYWTCKGMAFYTGGWGSGASCDRSTAANGDGGTGTVLPPVTAEPPPDDLPPNTAAPSSCPMGTFEGTINGTHTCVEDIGRPSSGSSPQTGTGTVQNPDGSTTTTTTTGTTTCTQGSCTTTNNTTTNITGNPNSTCPQGTTPSGPNGSASSCTGTSTSGSTEAQSEFCKDHPEDKQCGGEGGFAGTCASGFVATGDDPILNAMAKEQYTRNCEVLRTDTEPSTWVATEGQKTDNAMKDNPNNSTVSIGAGNFDTSDSLGGGGCNLNKTVVVRGYSVALPFNVLCDPLAVLGQILVAVSLLLAARIVTRG